MRRGLPGLAVLGAAATLPASPVSAGNNDDAWAKCIWEQVPTSGATWLSMPMLKPSWRHLPFEFPPEFVLQFRLRAACHDRLTPAGKRNPPHFDSKAVRRAMEAQRPASIGADKVDPLAYRCNSYLPNDPDFKAPAESSWGFGSDTSKAQFLLETSNLVPKGGPEQGWPRRCSFIQADGTFKDA